MPSDDPIIIEPRVKPAGSDDPIILEPDSVKNDGPPIIVQPVKVSWWKRWSTHLATLNATTLVATFALLPERIQEAFPQWSLIALGGAVLASVLIPAATSIKQVRKVE